MERFLDWVAEKYDQDRKHRCLITLVSWVIVGVYLLAPERSVLRYIFDFACSVMLVCVVIILIALVNSWFVGDSDDDTHDNPVKEKLCIFIAKYVRAFLAPFAYAITSILQIIKVVLKVLKRKKD